MKTNRTLLLVTLITTLCASNLLAQYSQNIVGFVNYPFAPGANLFGNPLQNTDSFLSTLFPLAPDNTTISLWDATTMSYNQNSTFSGHSWSVNLVIPPGTGARLLSGTPFTNTFVGTVLAPNGVPWDGIEPAPSPPPYAGPDGYFLLSSKFPAVLSDAAYPVFNNVLGRGPRNGEQFTWLDEATQTYHTTTFHLSSGDWDNGSPILGVGDAAFFNIGPVIVPEPAAVALCLAGLGMWVCNSRRRR